MCRVVAYLGHEILLDEVLIKPENSLLAQSKHAREMAHPTNGDGFGVGWYVPEISGEPGLFTSVFPAWNDRNLKHLASKIKSPSFFAHIRAASAGGVTNYNCHPFIRDNMQFMHNGTLGDFMDVKRHLRGCLDDDIYHWLKGETDSEHLFALFLQHAKKEKHPLTAESMTRVLEHTIHHAIELVEKYGNGAPSFLNLCITNGRIMVASRVDTSNGKSTRTLHVSVGERFEFKDGKAHMHPSKNKNGAVLISSETLNDFHAEWSEVKINSLITVNESLEISTQNF